MSNSITTLTYDPNGNMLAGLDGKIMTYDGENRPLSVRLNGKMTCYVYGADGTRLKKIENLAPAANCPAAPTASNPVTAYFANVEIRNFGQGTPEQIITYPVSAIRLVTSTSGGTTTTVASTLHRDQLASVRGLTGPDGLRAERATYRPFGEQDEFAFTLAANETRGFIGERYDADAGLQFLNARYYDPKLGLFLQPDWWEVTEAGVGTNRYAYSGNDPVNASGPGGNDSFGSGNPYDGYDTDGDGIERYAGGWTYDREKDLAWRDPRSDKEGKGGPKGSRGFGLATEGRVFFGSQGQVIERAFALSISRKYINMEIVAAIHGFSKGVFTFDEALNMAISGSISGAVQGPVLQHGTFAFRKYRSTGLQHALDHIMDRHGYNSTFTGVSRFSPSMDRQRIADYIDRALAAKKTTPSGDGATYFDLDVGHVTGYDQQGNLTTGIRVTVRDGEVHTAYPF